VSLRWRGREVVSRMERAENLAVNATMEEAVVYAKNNHEWQNRTSVLEGSIKIVEFASREGSGSRGLWGSTDVRYALIHELGGVIRPTKAPALMFRIDGQFVRVQQVRIPARPYLRPAADAIYPRLPDNIRRARRKLNA